MGTGDVQERQASGHQNMTEQGGDKDAAVKIRKGDDINHFDSVSNVMKSQDANILAQDEKNPTDSKMQRPTQQSGTKLKKMKKGIFISYSPDAGFIERKFVVETVRQLKENNLADDIWFDKDEKNTDSPCWFSLRMEAVEKCRAAILVLSESYFTCPVSMYEGKALLERQRSGNSPVVVFPILFSAMDNSEVSKYYPHLFKDVVDLTGENANASIAEKTSLVIGALMEEIEKFASIHAPPTPLTPPDSDYSGEYKEKKICQWSANDLQEWLFKLGIKEFYRQSLAEGMVDGFLLMSMTDYDMINHVGVDSRVVRKKIMQQILQTLDKEHKQPDNWHLRARALRPKSDVVYLIYDPADVRLAQNIKADLKKKNLQVIHHDSVKLGRSKEEFLQINGPHIATATHVLVLMTEAAISSPFVFHETLFADWLGKKLVTAIFKNIWPKLRASLKAVIGECPAIDFETKMYNESLDVLEHHIKPLRRVPGVVLEQAYLNKMADGLKPLEILTNIRGGGSVSQNSDGESKVFITYQWDVQAKVEDIRGLLENNGYPCWSDIGLTHQRGHSSKSTRSSVTSQFDTSSETLQSQIQRHMRDAAVVISCVTPKYLQSDNCIHDLRLAESFNKPILPIMLRFCPMESAPQPVRKIFAKLNFLDLSNDRLYKQNFPLVLEKVKKLALRKL